MPKKPTQKDRWSANKVAILIPCYNEELTIGAVVKAFRAAVPTADIFVFDNNSSDKTARAARSAGAEVFKERRQGKGHVVRRMFTDIEADIYVLVDGDATYDAASAPRMIDRLLDERLDMVVAARVERDDGAYRAGHRTGNYVLTRFVGHVFGRTFTDMLSGYRVFSRRFVKSFPILSGGFEIETELTIHALELGLPAAEIATPYFPRHEGSMSKLKTWPDGLRILGTVLRIYRAERPLALFGAIGAALMIISVALAIPVLLTFLETGLVPRLPTAVLSTGLMLLAFLSVAVGLILDTVTRGRREAKLFAYLGQRAPGEERRRD